MNETKFWLHFCILNVFMLIVRDSEKHLYHLQERFKYKDCGENVIILKILIIHKIVVSEFLMLVTSYDLVYKGISNINKQ